MSALVCPVCRGEMRESIREGISIDTCGQCRGVWLDRGELEKLATAIGGGFPPLAAGQGFWRQDNTTPLPAWPHQPQQDHHAARHQGWRGKDDDDDRRHYRDRRRPSKLSRLMDFFD